MGELQAREIKCTPFNTSTFSDALQTIRKLTTKKPKEVMPQMCTLCSEAGVALVFMPHWKQIPWKGASKWLSPEKALVVLHLSMRQTTYAKSERSSCMLLMVPEQTRRSLRQQHSPFLSVSLSDHKDNSFNEHRLILDT